MSGRIIALSTGADARLTNEGSPLAAVLVNGGTARAVPGTWSATSELLVAELADRFPRIAFAEVRYRVKTWNQLDSCMADAEAALDLVDGRGPRSALLIGFSMGGAVSIGVAGHEAVASVLALGFERARALGVDGTYTIIPRALHGAAVRRPSGALQRLPRWKAWVEHVGGSLERFAAEGAGAV
jgi:pimeloyl-ACP methyl ester carboxylesterase